MWLIIKILPIILLKVYYKCKNKPNASGTDTTISMSLKLYLYSVSFNKN